MKHELAARLNILGMDHDTATTYLACLTLGKSRATEIAKNAKLHRTVVYRHLEELADRGLLQVTLEANTRTYTPANPSIIAEIIKEKLAETESLIPTLLSLYAAASPGKPAFRYYTDVAGIRTVFEEMLLSPGKFYRHIGFFYQKEVRRLLGEKYLEDWTERRIALRVDHQSIRPMEWKAQERQEEKAIYQGVGKEFLRDYRYAPIPADLPVLIYLYDGKVAFLGARIGHIYAAVLESKDVFDTLNSIFDMIWKTGEAPVNAPTKR